MYQLQQLVASSNMVPSVVSVEVHPFYKNEELVSYCKKKVSLLSHSQGNTFTALAKSHLCVACIGLWHAAAIACKGCCPLPSACFRGCRPGAKTALGTVCSSWMRFSEACKVTSSKQLKRTATKVGREIMRSEPNTLCSAAKHGRQQITPPSSCQYSNAACSLL